MNIRMYLAGGIVLTILFLAWAANHYHKIAESWRDTARQSQEVVKQQAATITDMNQRQQQLVALDTKHTEALSAAESENDGLRRQLSAGTRRMYVSAKCPTTGTGKNTATSRLDNGIAVELAPDSRRNVLDIRAGIISDQAKVRYLQQYINEQCLR